MCWFIALLRIYYLPLFRYFLNQGSAVSFKLLWIIEYGACDFLSHLQLPSQVMWFGEECGFSLFQLHVFYELGTHSVNSVSFIIKISWQSTVLSCMSLKCQLQELILDFMTEYIIRFFFWWNLQWEAHTCNCILPLLGMSKVNAHMWSHEQTPVVWTCWLPLYVRENYLHPPSLRTVNDKVRVEGWTRLCVCVIWELPAARSLNSLTVNKKDNSCTRIFQMLLRLDSF